MIVILDDKNVCLKNFFNNISIKIENHNTVQYDIELVIEMRTGNLLQDIRTQMYLDRLRCFSVPENKPKCEVRRFSTGCHFSQK